MYCQFCGTKNTDGHQYCKKCGKPLPISEEPVHPDSSSSAEQQTTSPDQDCPNSGVVCPNCHAGAEYCYPIAKTDIKSSGGYSFWNGCCGMILLGPAGLLCGACGQTRTKVGSSTWWVCKNCGKEFMSTQSALGQANTSMISSAIYTAIIGFFLGIELQGDRTIWLIAILSFIALGLWGSILQMMEEVTRRSMEELLPERDLASFYGKMAVYGIGSLILGLLIGVAAV